MQELIWLLLPIAAASGWYAAVRSSRKKYSDDTPRVLPNEYIQGLNYLLAEQPDKALEVFIRLVEVDLDTFDTHLALGSLFRRRGEVDRAIRIHENLVKRPKLESEFKVKALLELARDYLTAGLLDRAEALLHEVIPYGTQNRKAYEHLRELYEQEKDWYSAIQMAVNLQSQTGRSQAHTIAHYYCELAELAAEKAQYDSAVQMAEKALSNDPDCARANILLGDYAFKQEDYSKAIQHYHLAHEQEPKLIPVTLDRLVLAHQHSGSSEENFRYLRELYAKTRNVPLLLFIIENMTAASDRKAVDSLLERELESEERIPLPLLREYLKRRAQNGSTDSLLTAAKAIDTHLGAQPAYLCSTCGLETKSMFWQCPGCHGWGTVKPVHETSITLT